MALRHSDRHLDPHGHSHGPRCDELHGRRIATARPQQNKGTRHLPTGALLAIRSSVCVISPTSHNAPWMKLTFLLQKISSTSILENLHLLNGNLIEFYQSLRLRHSIIDKHSVEVLHIR